MLGRQVVTAYLRLTRYHSACPRVNLSVSIKLAMGSKIIQPCRFPAVPEFSGGASSQVRGRALGRSEAVTNVAFLNEAGKPSRFSSLLLHFIEIDVQTVLSVKYENPPYLPQAPSYSMPVWLGSPPHRHSRTVHFHVHLPVS